MSYPVSSKVPSALCAKATRGGGKLSNRIEDFRSRRGRNRRTFFYGSSTTSSSLSPPFLYSSILTISWNFQPTEGQKPLSFESYCMDLHLSAREITIAKKFKARTLGRGKLLLDNYILVECGYRCATYEENKLHAQQDLRRSAISIIYFNDAKYSNTQIILSYENLIKFTETPTISYRMTMLARQQITKYMKICLGYDDLQNFKLVYNPLKVSENFYLKHKNLLSTVLLLPTCSILPQIPQTEQISQDNLSDSVISAYKPANFANSTDHHYKTKSPALKLYDTKLSTNSNVASEDASDSIMPLLSNAPTETDDKSTFSRPMDNSDAKFLQADMPRHRVSTNTDQSTSSFDASKLSSKSTSPTSRSGVIASFCSLLNPIKKTNRNYIRHLANMFSTVNT